MARLDELLNIAKAGVMSNNEKLELMNLLSSYEESDGRHTISICPYHKERTGSFTINPVDHTFHCFGCGVSGHLVFDAKDYGVQNG